MRRTGCGDVSCGRRAARCALVGLVACFGLLLWARLKLVTQTPRMVYADPKAKPAQVDPDGRSPRP